MSLIFLSFGVYQPPNATVVTSLFISALSVSTAVYLIMELYVPYSGLVHISDSPLRMALSQLGR